MNRFKHIVVFALMFGVSLLAGPFSITGDSVDNVAILYKGTPLITSVTSTTMANMSVVPRKYSRVECADGSTVFNVWNEELESRFRTEVAINAEGTEVEITFIAEAPAFHKETRTPKTLKLQMPFARFQDGKFEGYAGRATAEVLKNGVLAANTPKGSLLNTAWRFMAIEKGDDKLVFDMNPLGPGDFISIYNMGAIKGVWTVARNGANIELIGGSRMGNIGGMTGAKIRIKEGDMATYDKIHALRRFTYTDQMLAKYEFCFGAKVHGKQYTPADNTEYSESKGYGWLNASNMRLNNYEYPGAMYSNIQAGNKVFRMSCLNNGVWFVTLGLGNTQGKNLSFAFECNNVVIDHKFSVEPWKATVVTLPVWVENGIIDIKFRGDFNLSTLSAQQLIAAAEDFSFRRGPWKTDGFEPSVMFQNAHYRPEPEFKADIQTFDLPVPGKEAEATFKEPPITPSCAAPRNRKGLEWRDNAIFGQGLENSSSLAELDTPESREAFWEEQKRRCANAIIMSGLHSRHTYFTHLKRGQDFMSSISKEAHAHGIKIIDHHDTTLLWNLDGGFRIMAERLPEVNRNVADNLPAYQFCLNNPDFNRKYTEYILGIVCGGIDGFMIDESTFYQERCGCQYCRDLFHKETGWYIPVNETDDFFTNKRNPIRQAFLNWHKIKVGNWWADLRKAIDTVNPAVSLLIYTTHYGFTSNYASLGHGLDLLNAARGADFMGTEIMSRNIVRSARAIVPYRKAKNLLRTAFNIPIWGLTYGQQNNYAQSFGWAINTMHQQSTWNGEAINEEGPKYYMTLIDKHPELLRGTNVSKVAVLYSSNSRDWQQSPGFPTEIFGTAQTLESMHVPYEIIGEMTLGTPAMDKYDVLITAGASCLNEKETKALLDFAGNGGTLFITTNTGFYNENGDNVAKWPFADIFGCAPNMQKVENQKDAVKNGTNFTAEQPFMNWRLPNAAQNVETLCATPQNQPLCLRAKYGKGTVYYVSAYLATQLYAAEGTPGRVWNFKLDTQVDELYKKILDEAIGNSDCWIVEAPAAVYTMVYKLGNGYYIHFLNAQGSLCNEAGKPMPQELPNPAFPELKEDVKFAIPGFKPTKAYAISNDFEGKKPLEIYETEDNIWAVLLPKELLKVHTVVFVE